jgi:hypothetical protein
VPVATYDEIADRYEEHVGTRPDPLDPGRVLCALPGPGAAYGSTVTRTSYGEPGSRIECSSTAAR